MSYHMMGMSGNAEQIQSKMAMTHCNENMKHSATSEEAVTPEDCCTKNCNCFAGGCSTMPALIKYTGYYAFFSSLKIPSYSDSATRQQPNSPYRPPILS